MNTIHHKSLNIFSKLIGIALLLAMLLMPASLVSASASLAPDNHGVIDVIKFEDLNGDGVWQQPGEPVLAGWTFDLSMLVSGQYVYLSSGTTDATGHTTWSNLAPGTYKVREQTQPEYQSTTGLEQTVVSNNDTKVLKFGNRLRDVDFGDLPLSYGMTTRAQDGARNRPGAVILGSLFDTELDGLPNANATGDDLNNLDDEDGIQVVANPPDYWKNGTGTVQVTVSGGTGCLFAWMDVWNSNTNSVGTDSDFNDSGPGWSEAIIVNMAIGPGTQMVSFPLPQNAATYPVWARFRILDSNQGDCSWYVTNPVTPYGYRESGEVEDYYFNFNPTAVSLASFTAQTSGVNQNLVNVILVLVAAAGLLLGSRVLAVRLSNR